MRITRCSTYVFAQPAPAMALSVVRRGPEDYAAVAAGREVARATSSRSNTLAAELWVHTDPEFQRQGHGGRVAAAWAADVLTAKKIAFYSHLDDNQASRRLAAGLGVKHVFDLAHLAVEP
jgi:predicted GNAT family acetyltransferase